MRRIPVILLLLAVAALGTGALRYVHELDHLAREAHHHDEDDDDDGAANCFLHAQLNLPMVDGGWVPVLVCIGLFIAFLTHLTVPVRSRRPLLQLDCRGPPV